MAHIVDTRYAGGEFVVLGDALTLPASSQPSTPSAGSLRYNPSTDALELYSTGIMAWMALGSGGSGGSGGGSPLIFNPSTGYLLAGNLTVNGLLTVTGSVFGSYFSGT